MDLSTIKKKIEGGMYGSWNEIAVRAAGCSSLAAPGLDALVLPCAHVWTGTSCSGNAAVV
jgi:hypothetical protein